MKRKMRKYRDYLIEELADREKAISYLQTALEEYQRDRDTAAFLLALRSVVEAQGGIREIARRAHADPQDLLRVLVERGWDADRHNWDSSQWSGVPAFD